MRLIKIFDKHVDYEWSAEQGIPTARFQLGDTPYVVMFIPYEHSFGMFSSLELLEKHSAVVGMLSVDNPTGDLSFGGTWSGSYLTDSGNEFAFFSTAIKIFEEYVVENKPEVFVVTALEAERRHEVYAKIAQRITKRIEKRGYTLAEEETHRSSEECTHFICCEMI